MSNEILQTLLETAIQVLLPIVLGALVVLVHGMLAEVKARVDKDQLAMAESLIRSLVKAAQQNGLIGMLEKEGAAKKDWVIAQVEAALAKRGIVLDLHEIDALIEAIYYDEIGQFKEWKKLEADEPTGAG
jgi:hypothetical protein